MIYLSAFFSSGISCRIPESKQNIELDPFLNYCSNSVNHKRVQVLSYCKYSSLVLTVVGIEPAT